MRKLYYLSLLFLIFTSCASYNQGFFQQVDNSTRIRSVDSTQIDSLRERKKRLNAQSKTIVESILQRKNAGQAIAAYDLNRLFENLNLHYQIDSTFQYLYQYSKDDSVKEVYKKELILSAIQYNSLFQSDKGVRRIINRGDLAFCIQKRTLVHTQRFLWSALDLKYSNSLNHSLNHTRCRFLWQTTRDDANALVYGTAGLVNEAFGRLFAAIHARPEPKVNVEKLMPRLKKWDIIIQKSPRRATDFVIPGYFGHAGIYLGDSIFAESIQKGVIHSNPNHFAEGGMFLVIRPKDLTAPREARMQHLVNGQIGKKYDFNFNNCSPNKVVCTELVYLVYENIPWITDKMMGVFTLSPDDIVRTALSSDQLQVTLYFDEKHLWENPSAETIKELLSKH